jgi:hypothetical protein
VQKPHEKIRSELLSSIKDERTKLIMRSNFTSSPQFEDKYFEYVFKHPEYYQIYKKWVCSQSPIPVPEDEDLIFLRNAIFNNRKIIDGESFVEVVNKPVLYFFIDITWPFIKQLVDKGLAYYKIKNSDKPLDAQIMSAIITAAVPSLAFSDLEDITKEGYPYLLTSFLDKFRVFFFGEIAAPVPTLPDDDAKFIRSVEQEWLKLYDYSDSCYGFEVMPTISPQDMIRYFMLPFNSKRYRELSESKIYRQMMNYFVSIATFKPVPDTRIKIYYQHELCKLFVPLAKNLAKRHIRNKSFILDESKLQPLIEGEISKLPVGFNFFFKTIENLKKGKELAFQNKIFPMNGQTVKLGHIFDSDEYPFTDFVVKKIEAKMKKYFEMDKRLGTVSLDETYFDEEGEEKTLAEGLADSDTGAETHIPNYDAGGKDDLVGWKIETFARIVGKSADTLRRWDRNGYLKPKRYSIRSKIYRKNIEYRVYVRDDIVKVKEVAIRMEKKEKHKK